MIKIAIARAWRGEGAGRGGMYVCIPPPAPVSISGAEVTTKQIAGTRYFVVGEGPGSYN